MATTNVKPELEPLPERMKDLKVDERGFPVPWFVAWIDGKPEFRAMDSVKFKRAIREKLCWVCGHRLGVNVCFVVGPMCGINRTASEPPSHVECAGWSARNCPFLNNPRMVRREDDLINKGTQQDLVAGVGLSRNPGVTLLWLTRSYEIFRVPGSGSQVLITMGEPDAVKWYACGKTATRAEVQESIDTGLPNLEAMARTETGGIESLRKAQNRFEKWLPA